MAPESRLNAAAEVPACADVINRHVRAKILIMEGGEKYYINTLTCDKKVAVTHKDMKELLAVGTKILAAPHGGEGLGQSHMARRVFASIVQNMQTCLTFVSMCE